MLRWNVLFFIIIYIIKVDGFLTSLAKPKSFKATRWSRSDLQLRKDDDDDLIIEEVDDLERRNLVINIAAGGILATAGVSSFQLFKANAYTPDGFVRQPLQFIAALGDPKSKQGTGADQWGLWRKDPGPRGVFLRDYDRMLGKDGAIAPVGWKFDAQDWWLEEHGIIMEKPEFPITPGRYLVTGGRSVTTGLTIRDDYSWSLDEGTLYDVTHLPCRSARYHPVNGGSPLTANLRDFPVLPGAAMPNVSGCSKQDYAVLFLVGKAKS